MKQDSVELEKVQAIAGWLIDLRRTIHRNPELSYHEHETAALISSSLKEIGLEVTDGVAGTGVVGLLRGYKQGPTIALRADIDALPINEASEVPYKSIHKDRMHACGHDGHTSIVLGAAKLLFQMRGAIAGNVKFIFQPAEEVPPEGGAKGMIAAGVLEEPKVDAVFGLHIWPDLPTGNIGLKYGPIMAAPDMFKLSIQGKGGHGAAPHQSNDTMVAAAQVIMGLQTLVSRKVNPLEPVVLSICKISGGSAYNILPDEVCLEGTTRYFEKEMGAFLEEQIHQTVGGICQSSGTSYELEYQYGFPPTINNPKMVDIVAHSAVSLLGEDHVDWVEVPSMTGEDFSYFLQKVPGCYFWLGTRNPSKGIVHPLHSSQFQIDEDILPLGVAVLSKSVIDFLQQEQG